MKIDKKQSLKNKIGVVAVSLVLSGALMPSTALAENFNYTDEQTKVEFIYDDDHVGRGKIDDGYYKLVVINNLENGDYALVSLKQLDEILKSQTGDTIIIDDEVFSRESVLEARKCLQEKIDEEEAKKLSDGKIGVIFYGFWIALAISSKAFLNKRRNYTQKPYGYSLKQFVYNIKRGFQEDKSRRQFTKYIKIK